MKPTENQPIPGILSYFPEDENFLDTREGAGGAWISEEAWRNIRNSFSSFNDEEVIKTIKEIEEERSNCPPDAAFIYDYQFAILETKLPFAEEQKKQTAKIHREAERKRLTDLKSKGENKQSLTDIEATAIKTAGSKAPSDPLRQSNESPKLPPKETWEQRNNTAITRALQRKGWKKIIEQDKKNQESEYCQRAK